MSDAAVLLAGFIFFGFTSSIIRVFIPGIVPFVIRYATTKALDISSQFLFDSFKVTTRPWRHDCRTKSCSKIG